MIIDELHIAGGEPKEIRGAGTFEVDRSEFPQLLKYLREKCDKTVIVLSSSSVIDGYSIDQITSEKLKQMIQSSGYKTVSLKKVMRNTARITNSVTAENYNSYNNAASYSIAPSILGGESSTVMGQKPTAIIYPWGDDICYRVLGQCVKRYLDDYPQIRDTKLAILCDQWISVRELKPWISSFIPDMKCYDAGINKFNQFTNCEAEYSENRDNSDTNAVISWLEEGGTLLTFSYLFRGCEAESVIVVCNDWAFGSGKDTPRSAATRGVANMCIIISERKLKANVMEKHFNVIKLNKLK